MPERRSTMVAVPFLAEDPELVARTLETAASHPAVREVIGVHGQDAATNEAVRNLAPRARLVAQERIGHLRPGKGDAVNTAFARFLDTDCERLHFYDADIKTFDIDWIELAELGLDRGFASVRHFYPRSPTDGMITAMLVRPALAMRWPDSFLARVRQPLSGELAFNRAAAETIAGDGIVQSQSDWGIDTVLTVASAQHGLAVYENLIARGKDHQLYGSLEELEPMFWECLHALQRVWARPTPPGGTYAVDEQSEETQPPVTELVAFDRQLSERILLGHLAREEEHLLVSHFPHQIAEGVRSSSPNTFDTAAWLECLKVLVRQALFDDPSWRSLGFRLWTSRVLYYTHDIVVRGYRAAMEYLDDMVRQAMLNPVN